jgi:hypothetical protein
MSCWFNGPKSMGCIGSWLWLRTTEIFYMVLEEVEEQGMFAWIVYLDSEERFVEEVEVETLLALATPVQPNWEEHQWFPIR